MSLPLDTAYSMAEKVQKYQKNNKKFNYLSDWMKEVGKVEPWLKDIRTDSVKCYKSKENPEG